MITIEILKQLESELNSLREYYSGTLAAITLEEERKPISKVITFLEEKEEWFKCLYYNRILKENIHFLSFKEIEKLNNNWLNSNDMIQICDKYNLKYNVINFKS